VASAKRCSVACRPTSVWPVDRNSRARRSGPSRRFQHEIPGRGRRRDRIAQAEGGIEQPPVQVSVQEHRLRILEIEDDVDGVALDCRPAVRVEAESLVEALDRASMKPPL